MRLFLFEWKKIRSHKLSGILLFLVIGVLLIRFIPYFRTVENLDIQMKKSTIQENLTLMEHKIQNESLDESSWQYKRKELLEAELNAYEAGDDLLAQQKEYEELCQDLELMEAGIMSVPENGGMESVRQEIAVRQYLLANGEEYVESQMTGLEVWRFLYITVEYLLPILLPLFSVLMCVSAILYEKRHRTWNRMFLQPMSIAQIISSKYIATLVSVLVMCVVILGVISGAVGIFGSLGDVRYPIEVKHTMPMSLSIGTKNYLPIGWYVAWRVGLNLLWTVAVCTFCFFLASVSNRAVFVRILSILMGISGLGMSLVFDFFGTITVGLFLLAVSIGLYDATVRVVARKMRYSDSSWMRRKKEDAPLRPMYRLRKDAAQENRLQDKKIWLRLVSSEIKKLVYSQKFLIILLLTIFLTLEFGMYGYSSRYDSLKQQEADIVLNLTLLEEERKNISSSEKEENERCEQMIAYCEQWLRACQNRDWQEMLKNEIGMDTLRLESPEQFSNLQFVTSLAECEERLPVSQYQAQQGQKSELAYEGTPGMIDFVVRNLWELMIPILIFLLCADTISNERGNGVLKLWFIQPFSRGSFLRAKAAAAFCMVEVIWLAATGTCLALGGLMAGVGNWEFPMLADGIAQGIVLGGHHYVEFSSYFLCVTLYQQALVIFYLALAMLFSVWIEDGTYAMGAGVALVVLVKVIDKMTGGSGIDLFQSAMAVESTSFWGKMLFLCLAAAVLGVLAEMRVKRNYENRAQEPALAVKSVKICGGE